MSIDFFKKTWFTSDWHLGHDNVLKFCPDRKCDDMDQMAEILIKNYNNSVKDGDVCYFLGDFIGARGYGKTALGKLKGTKILVRGNHDSGHQSMKNMGFDAVLDQLTIKTNDWLITASHFPLTGTGFLREDVTKFRSHTPGEIWHKEHKMALQYPLVTDIGQDLHLHGHIHSPNRGLSSRIQGKQFDVGVDANNMRPISLSYIVKMIKKN